MEKQEVLTNESGDEDKAEINDGQHNGSIKFHHSNRFKAPA